MKTVSKPVKTDKIWIILLFLKKTNWWKNRVVCGIANRFEKSGFRWDCEPCFSLVFQLVTEYRWTYVTCFWLCRLLRTALKWCAQLCMVTVKLVCVGFWGKCTDGPGRDIARMHERYMCVYHLALLVGSGRRHRRLWNKVGSRTRTYVPPFSAYCYRIYKMCHRCLYYIFINRLKKGRPLWSWSWMLISSIHSSQDLWAEAGPSLFCVALDLLW